MKQILGHWISHENWETPHTLVLIFIETYVVNYWECRSSSLMALLLLSHFSRVQLCATPETAAHQAPPSLRFSRQGHWSGLPFPSPLTALGFPNGSLWGESWRRREVAMSLSYVCSHCTWVLTQTHPYTLVWKLPPFIYICVCISNNFLLYSIADF